MIKHVLFDLDGTVIDSRECIWWVYRRLFAKHGLPLPAGEGLRRFIGPPIETTIGSFVPADKVKEVCDDFHSIYKTVDLISTNFLYDGVLDAVERIKKSGKKAYIATSKNEPVAVKILRGLSAYEAFDGGVYGSRYDLGEKNRMKKADIIENLLAENGIKKEECILVGDTLFDVDGAKKCGIPVAIVRYGFGSPQDFVGEKIAFFADSPADLASKLEEYRG